MHIRRSVLIFACFALLFLTSCTSKALKSSNQASYNAAATTSSGSALPSQYRNIDINSEASALSTQPGQVALALIICKLDNTKVLDELVKQDPHSLFDLLNETALQKSLTLESLDEQYGLTDILASLNIYVNIKSNTVTSVPTPSSASQNWITKFQQAINAN